MADEDWSCACAELIERSVEIAADSLALRRALSSFGIATEAMIAMMATTIMSSMSVKPAFLRVLNFTVGGASLLAF